MKVAVQLLACAAALSGLLFGAASHATNLAELPLKTAVLAKPNVIFGMDDSGSMDWEILLATDDGLAWWNGSTAWDSATNRPLKVSGSDNNRLSYLFPMGTDKTKGGQIYANGTGNGDHRSVPPTAQFAWLRSNALNPIYYNTWATYPAWSPAYVNGALKNDYINAPPAAAQSHPGPLSGSPTTLNVGSDWASGSTNFADDNFAFGVIGGMVLPAGTSVVATNSTSGICSGSTRQTLTAATVVPSGARCLARIPYYPATFWQRTVCPAGDTACTAVPDCTVDNPLTNPNSSCVAAPDGVGKLRRYEIKSGNSFPSGRNHADELQNFANWFTYYRKRKLMLAGAMGRALEPITGIRMGVVPFGSTPTVTMHDADASSAADNRYRVAGHFYLNATGSGTGTPTHKTVKHIGSQFNTNTSVIQYACQRNSMFIVTDGFANSHSETTPSYDKNKFGGNTAPYATTVNNSLADLALSYFTNRLRAGDSTMPAGRVPSGDPARRNPDLNTDLHITTYGITLGARGTLYPTALNPFAIDVFATPPTWPTPVADDPTMVDDLWHATVNGRGQMYLATDVDAMRLSIQAAFNDILSQEGAQGGIAVSAVNLDRGDSQAYLGSYNPAGWAGDLTANPINTATAAVTATPNWSAATLLAARDWTTRRIFSSSGSTGMDFSSVNVGATVNPAPASFTNAEVVDYLRGSRAGEGSTFRARASLIGAVVNAEPVLARDEKMVYLASGDGMLHAFDTVTGKEEWAYAPPDTLAALGRSVQRGWVYQTLLDATPTYGPLTGGNKLLVGGLGAAGRSYYAIDVSSPKNLSSAAAAAQFRWIFPASTDTTNRANMGFPIGKPALARTTDHGDVVLVTSGVDNGITLGDGKGRLWMLNASTGAVIKTFRTTGGAVAPGQEAGLSHVSAFKEADGNVRYVYGGDLLGNLWRFDLQKTGAGELAPDLIAVLKDGAGNLQPVTSAPELTTIGDKRIVLVGTGRLLDISDFGSSRTQSFYAIADGATLSNARTGLVAQTYVRATDTLSSNTVNWTTGRGWYVDLPAGEQANTDAIVTYGAVAFVTNKNGSTDCSQSSYMYLIDIGTGSQVVNPNAAPGTSFVSQEISNNATSSRVITLRVINGKIVGTTHRSNNTVFQRELPLGQNITPAKNAWREIRR